ncbi:alpha/beta fold hydrolase, partial [Nocardioides sp.]|uniref:alpha/beta fold hydrolase n=1 Tax=Nocardioides sp. TaxID=35761 RepID=UPI002733F73B
HPAANLGSMVRSNQLLRSWYMLFFQLPWLPELTLSRTRGSRRMLRRLGMTDAMIRAFREEIVEDGALRGGLNYYRAIPLSDLRRAWKRVAVPTTHVWSDNDPALGRKGADLTERYVDADYRLEVLPGVGHWVPEQAPEHLADIICARMGLTVG